MSVCLATDSPIRIGHLLFGARRPLNHTLDFKSIVAELSLSIVGVLPYFSSRLWQCTGGGMPIVERESPNGFSRLVTTQGRAAATVGDLLEI